MKLNAEQHKALQGVAKEVMDFYEQYPYPHPVESLDNYQQLWADPQRRRADYHLFFPSCSYNENRTLLVAGCGTTEI